MAATMAYAGFKSGMCNRSLLHVQVSITQLPVCFEKCRQRLWCHCVRRTLPGRKALELRWRAQGPRLVPQLLRTSQRPENLSTQSPQVTIYNVVYRNPVCRELLLSVVSFFCLSGASSVCRELLPSASIGSFFCRELVLFVVTCTEFNFNFTVQCCRELLLSVGSFFGSVCRGLLPSASIGSFFCRELVLFVVIWGAQTEFPKCFL